MSFYAALAKVGLGAATGTMSAIANKKSNDRKEAGLLRELQGKIHLANSKSIRTRSAAAVRGFEAGANLGYNEYNQSVYSSIETYNMMRQSLRASTEAGIISAATLSLVDVSSAAGEYKSEQDTISKTSELESLTGSNSSLTSSGSGEVDAGDFNWDLTSNIA